MTVQLKQDNGPFQWDNTKREAVVQIAEGTSTFQQIANSLGVSRVALFHWRTRPEFDAEVKALEAALAAEVQMFAIGRRRERMRAKNERWVELRRIAAARAAYHEAHGTSEPGATTGYLTKTYKSIGSGAMSYAQEEWAVDVGLARELRELEKEASIEAGQRTEKADTEVNVGVRFNGPPRVVRILNQTPRPYTRNREGMDEPGRFIEVEGVWQDKDTGKPWSPEHDASAIEAISESTPETPKPTASRLPSPG